MAVKLKPTFHIISHAAKMFAELKVLGMHLLKKVGGKVKEKRNHEND